AHSRQQRVGVALGRIPLLGQQRLFDRVAAEREMVMTDGAFHQQGFAGAYRGLLSLAVWFQQGQEAEKNRPHVSGARLVRGRQSCRTSDSASSRRPSTIANSAVCAR